MKYGIIAILLISNCLALNAQELEEIVVTASMRSGDYYEMPAVTIKKEADYLVQNIRLINDSRSPELRRNEIIRSIDGLIKASKRIKGIELSYGNGFLEPVKLNDDSLELIEDRKKVDTSYVNIFAKVAFDKSLPAKQQILVLRKFIKNANPAGRTEIDSLGDIGLSIIGPEQYRYEILAKIAAESRKVIEAMGPDCETTIGGLEGRVEWDRSGVGELTLYIPYGSEITCK
ncbi:MAG: hypothetical protein AB8B48_21205 [Pseudomonadales bacterium]